MKDIEGGIVQAYPVGVHDYRISLDLLYLWKPGLYNSLASILLILNTILSYNKVGIGKEDDAVHIPMLIDVQVADLKPDALCQLCGVYEARIVDCLRHAVPYPYAIPKGVHLFIRIIRNQERTQHDNPVIFSVSTVRQFFH